MTHGLAGSAALMLMVVSAVHTVWQGLAYILVFGIGSIAGMMLLGLLMSLPLVISSSVGARAQLVLQAFASLGSVSLGVMIMVRTAWGDGPL